MDNIEKFIFVLDEETRNIILREAKLYGASYSGTLRRIVKEWNRSNNPEPVVIGGEPAEKEA